MLNNSNFNRVALNWSNSCIFSRFNNSILFSLVIAVCQHLKPNHLSKDLKMFKNLIAIVFILFFAQISSAGETRENFNSIENCESVFGRMTQPKPEVINSRLEIYTPSILFWKFHDRIGEWEFELIATANWLQEAKSGFIKAEFSDPMRKPSVQWWKPNSNEFDVFSLPFSSYSSSHIFIEKNPKSDSEIHVYIQRH